MKNIALITLFVVTMLNAIAVIVPPDLKEVLYTMGRLLTAAGLLISLFSEK